MFGCHCKNRTSSTTTPPTTRNTFYAPNVYSGSLVQFPQFKIASMNIDYNGKTITLNSA